MKLTKILLTALVTLTFTTTANADRYKFQTCTKAETAFWDIIQNTNTSIDQSLIESLGEQDQIAYYNVSMGNLEKSLTEVRKRCKGVASKDILDAYKEKKSEIQKKLNAL